MCGPRADDVTTQIPGPILDMMDYVIGSIRKLERQIEVSKEIGELEKCKAK